MVFSAFLFVVHTAHASSQLSECGEPTYAAWSEFIPYQKVEQYLPALRQSGVQLFLAIHSADVESPDLYRTWAAAQAMGVPVRPWLLLDEAGGYWANKWNAPAVEEMVWRFLTALHARGLNTDWVTLDFEPPPDFNRDLLARLQKRDLIGAWEVIIKHAKSGNFLQAHARYAKLVRALHKQGLKVHAVTTPFVIHDLKNHDYRVQNAFGTPVQDIPFDEVSFMVYRADYRRMLGDVKEDIVYRYSKVVKQHYGCRGAVDLGEVGHVQFPRDSQGYSDPAMLNADYSAARAGGIDNFHVYSLDGLAPELEQNPHALERWFVAPPAHKPKKDLLSRFYIWAVEFLTGFLPDGKRPYGP